MTDYRKPKTTVPIATEQVTSVSKGQVSGLTWNAGEGLSRQQEIERARLEALAQYEKEKEAAQPHNQRIERLEVAVQLLKSEITLLKTKLNNA